MSDHSHRRPSWVARSLAAIAITSIYCFSFVGAAAVVSGVTSSEAHAQRGRGRGRGYSGRGYSGRGRGRGWDRGRGRGSYGGRCVVNAAGVRICL
ncbi:conserved hypothetical protein [Rhodopseudomonas palustris TIE-1]|uniref:hypothetical protein n=1 Tax=Rhodopseudomonas palustris TaxID=1076 RepID=UPI000177972E|nr:hypothetical protein [Rhodopseudomonas palustris]ACF00303.1 conserved hypothetical protein [Rhodopseudomonas palustris TIE-1]RIA02444.1 hypothetical protein D1920_07705 [Rhodopseudomonas palustris]